MIHIYVDFRVFRDDEALSHVIADNPRPPTSSLHPKYHHRGLEKVTTATVSWPWASLDIEPYVSSDIQVKRSEDQLVGRNACLHLTSASCFRS